MCFAGDVGFSTTLTRSRWRTTSSAATIASRRTSRSRCAINFGRARASGGSDERTVMTVEQQVLCALRFLAFLLPAAANAASERPALLYQTTVSKCVRTVATAIACVCAPMSTVILMFCRSHPLCVPAYHDLNVLPEPAWTQCVCLCRCAQCVVCVSVPGSEYSARASLDSVYVSVHNVFSVSLEKSTGVWRHVTGERNNTTRQQITGP